MYRGHRFPHLIAPSVLFGMQQQPFWIGFLWLHAVQASVMHNHLHRIG
jgi:hypothetical protein